MKELVSHLDEQGKFLAEQEHSSNQLGKELAQSKHAVADLRAALAAAEHEREQAVESLTATKAQLERQLVQSQEERAKLLRDIETSKREAEATWEAERMENAVMRERINDVAAEVARLTSVLEGPTSPIDAILADNAPPPSPANGTRNGNKVLVAVSTAAKLKGFARRPDPSPAEPNPTRAAAQWCLKSASSLDLSPRFLKSCCLGPGA